MIHHIYTNQILTDNLKLFSSCKREMQSLTSMYKYCTVVGTKKKSNKHLGSVLVVIIYKGKPINIPILDYVLEYRSFSYVENGPNLSLCPFLVL